MCGSETRFLRPDQGNRRDSNTVTASRTCSELHLLVRCVEYRISVHVCGTRKRGTEGAAVGIPPSPSRGYLVEAELLRQVGLEGAGFVSGAGLEEEVDPGRRVQEVIRRTLGEAR